MIFYMSVKFNEIKNPSIFPYIDGLTIKLQDGSSIDVAWSTSEYGIDIKENIKVGQFNSRLKEIFFEECLSKDIDETANLESYAEDWLEKNNLSVIDFVKEIKSISFVFADSCETDTCNVIFDAKNISLTIYQGKSGWILVSDINKDIEYNIE